ncbi:hypothetical protein ACFXPM_33170 [Streptomyces sp. NPDC059095]|uniref:hypothetical protein n=1 Tax=unclassified Streptomyces TaxID=2593676 RepID=UPI0035D9BEC5
MNSIMNRIIRTKAAKGAVIAAMAAAAIGLTAPTSSASNESTWQAGCRGYWYSTSGHGYCYSANTFLGSHWYTTYDCASQIDTQHNSKLYQGYEGKYDTYECRFSINKTRVYQ